MSWIARATAPDEDDCPLKDFPYWTMSDAHVDARGLAGRALEAAAESFFPETAAACDSWDEKL